MAGHPWLARIYYCLQMAGHKPSASALLYKPYFVLIKYQYNTEFDIFKRTENKDEEGEKRNLDESCKVQFNSNV